jgi:hypothetical protein
MRECFLRDLISSAKCLFRQRLQIDLANFKRIFFVSHQGFVMDVHHDGDRGAVDIGIQDANVNTILKL